MRWLNPDRHDRDQRGAVAVVVALLMVALLGAAAISIDVASIYADRQQLQTGADAASLAIAQDCVTHDCGDYQATAQHFGTVNKNDGHSTATVVTPGLSYATGHVTVDNSTVTHHWFAPVLGYDATSQTVSSTASWGAPSGGTSALPVAFSWCDWQAQTGGGLPSGTISRVVSLPKHNQTSCNGPSGNPIPGGFGWIVQDGDTCQATTTIGENAPSDTGNNVKCSAEYFAGLQNKTVLLPIYSNASDEGSNGYYTIMGYAAFTITGYFLNNNISWNAPCGNPDKCFSGYFTRFVTQDGWQTSPSAPQLGAEVVRLTD